MTRSLQVSTRPLPGRRPAARLVAALALFGIAACSAEVATPIPQVDGRIAGGEPAGSSPAPDAGSSATSTPPPGGSSGGGTPSSSGAATDAGVSVEADGSSAAPPGGGYFIDSGSTPPPAQGGPLGSCGNPACATDGNECGCQATDSNGNTIQMGCQAGGGCICVVDQQTTGQPFDEDGACSDQQATAAQFFEYCPCQ